MMDIPREILSIAIVPGTFKGTLKSVAVAEAMKNAVEEVCPDAKYIALPLADGGDGTLEILSEHIDVEIKESIVSNPLGEKTNAQWLISGDTIFIETAQTIGLSLLAKEQRNPLDTSTFGLGELISETLDYLPKKLFITMGDSSTMDVGIGMLAALGVRYYDDNNNILDPIVTNMNEIRKIDTRNLDPRLEEVDVIGLADTNNPLCGHEGQTTLYGKQKGLPQGSSNYMVEAMERFGSTIEMQFHNLVNYVPHTSASGGVAAALLGVLGAKLVYTLDYLNSLIRHREIVSSVDLVITGEGTVDRQTKYGKVPYDIAKSSQSLCIVISGNCTMEGYSDLKELGNVTQFCLPQQKELIKDSDISTSQAIVEVTKQVLRTINFARINDNSQFNKGAPPCAS